MTAAEVAALLKAARPHKLRVVLTDDTERSVALPKGRNRWSAAARVIDELSWSEVHPLDAHGAICAPPLKRDMTAPAGDLVELPGTLDPRSALVAQVSTTIATVLGRVVEQAHRQATASAVELVTRLRSTIAGELKDVLAAHRDLTQLALDRSNYFEDRLAELEDDRRAELERRAERARRAPPEDAEAARERWIADLLLGSGPGRRRRKKAPNGASDGGESQPDQGDDDQGEVDQGEVDQGED